MRRIAALMLLVLAAASPARAAERMYAYDPADEETRRRLETGLTIVFDRGFFGMTVKEIIATRARARTYLEPAAERDLGTRLASVLPEGAQVSELYAVAEREQGPGMVRALCPGSTRGWLAFPAIRARRSLVIQALGDDPATGKARHCASLRLTFRGEWALPPVGRSPGMTAFERPRLPF